MGTLKRSLIVHYSRTGHTKQAAEEVARALDGTMERIRPIHDAHGARGFLRALWNAIRRRAMAIEPSAVDPATFGLVVIATPLWVGHLAPPVRAWAQAHAAACKSLAVLVTSGSQDGAAAYAELAALAGRKPIGTVTITEGDRRKGEADAKLAAFANRIAGIAALLPVATRGRRREVVGCSGSRD